MLDITPWCGSRMLTDRSCAGLANDVMLRSLATAILEQDFTARSIAKGRSALQLYCYGEICYGDIPPRCKVNILTPVAFTLSTLEHEHE